MVKYIHKYLNNEEENKFTELFKHNVQNNFIVSLFFKSHWIALIYPMIIGFLLYGTIKFYTSVYSTIIFFLLGFIAIQLKFVFAHMWAHSLMLQYDLWNIDGMPNVFGNIASVIFYAFFHHHHRSNDSWMMKKLGHSEWTNSFATAFTHWESFSLFTQTYPFNSIIIKVYLVWVLYRFSLIWPYLLGHEIGVLLLPISHDWVHERKSSKFGIYYLLKPLEYFGIFATKETHKRHHEIHDTVYQGFTSSGLYSARFDTFVDNIWNHYYKSDELGSFKEYKICYDLGKIMLGVYLGVMFVPVLFM